MVVVNGEQDWNRYLPDLEVVHRRIQSCGWVLRRDGLWVIDAEGGVRVDAVLWRVGAIRPDRRHRLALELIRLAGVPCVNGAAPLLRCFERLSMLAELRDAGVPVVPFSVAVGDALVRRIDQPLPAVLKVGSHHGGYGKTRIETAEQWSELTDLLFAADDYITVEPFLPHKRDVRCLLIGDRVWGMVRRGVSWRANVDTVKHQPIEPPPLLEEWTRRAAAHLGAQVLALDALELDDGSMVVLESNETPGLAGFPEATREGMAGLLRSAM